MQQEADCIYRKVTKAIFQFKESSYCFYHFFVIAYLSFSNFTKQTKTHQSKSFQQSLFP